MAASRYSLSIVRPRLEEGYGVSVFNYSQRKKIIPFESEYKKNNVHKKHFIVHGFCRFHCAAKNIYRRVVWSVCHSAALLLTPSLKLKNKNENLG